MKERAVLDWIRNTGPSSPEAVIDYAFRNYRFLAKGNVSGMPGEFGQEFLKHGVKYIHSDKNRSEIYLEFLPACNSGRVELLDIPGCGTSLSDWKEGPGGPLRAWEPRPAEKMMFATRLPGR